MTVSVQRSCAAPGTTDNGMGLCIRLLGGVLWYGRLLHHIMDGNAARPSLCSVHVMPTESLSEFLSIQG